MCRRWISRLSVCTVLHLSLLSMNSLNHTQITVFILVLHVLAPERLYHITLIPTVPLRNLVCNSTYTRSSIGSIVTNRVTSQSMLLSAHIYGHIKLRRHVFPCLFLPRRVKTQSKIYKSSKRARSSNHEHIDS